MQLADFRSALSTHNEFAIAQDILMVSPAEHVTVDQISEVQSRLALAYNVNRATVQVKITGSAQLGFSIVEKNVDGRVMPRYRRFSADSDIDIAVIAPDIFEVIWEEVGGFACSRTYFPPRFEKFGDYLVPGWMRPDKFPKSRSLIHANGWWDVFREIRRDRVFGIRKVAGGLFYSEEFLKNYLARGVRECIAEENTP